MKKEKNLLTNRSESAIIRMSSRERNKKIKGCDRTQERECATMTNTKKMTQRDYFAEIRAILDAQGKTELVEFVDSRVAQLDKKNKGEKKPTAVQIANEGIKSAIAEGMESGVLYTVTDIQKSVAECAELSNQRVSALLRQMVEAGIVTRTEDKRKAYFSLA